MNQALSREFSQKIASQPQQRVAKPSAHPWQRMLLALAVASVLALGSLYLMQQLVSQRQAIASKDYDFNVIDFVRLKQDSDVETRQRTRPEPPEPPQEMAPQPVSLSQPQTMQPQDMEFDMPEMDLPTHMTDGPRLGGLMSHQSGAAHSSIIPMVRIQPQYPRRAVMRGIEGEVVLAFIITPTGTVTDIEVISATPPGVFERAAKRALMKWKFKAKIVDGKPVSQHAQQNFVFKLENQ